MRVAARSEDPGASQPTESDHSTTVNTLSSWFVFPIRRLLPKRPAILPVSLPASRRVRRPPTHARTIAAAPRSPNRDSLAPHRPVRRLSTNAAAPEEAPAAPAPPSVQTETAPRGVPSMAFYLSVFHIKQHQ